MSVRAFGLLMVVFVFLNTTNSQVLINEIQSSNVVTAKDEFNEYPDWIELINNSGNTVNLGGWYLSDEKDSLDKWSFPAIQLLPSQHLLVFASGKDLKQLPAYWHTIIDAGSEWKYVVPTDTVSANWKSVNYSDAYWPSGTSGFGYADDDDSTPVSYGTISIYTRKKFSLSSLGNITSIFLHVDYDDGFVAYLNGAEVARVNLGTAGTAVTYNQLASPDHEALMYQGQQPSVFDISAFIGQLVV